VAAKANAFKDLGYDILEIDTIWVPLPESLLQCDVDSQQAKTLQRIIDELGEEGVTGVHSNIEIA
jgi:transcriptional/translational regulatory protein YebC/TACO1